MSSTSPWCQPPTKHVAPLLSSASASASALPPLTLQLVLQDAVNELLLGAADPKAIFAQQRLELLLYLWVQWPQPSVQPVLRAQQRMADPLSPRCIAVVPPPRIRQTDAKGIAMGNKERQRGKHTVISCSSLARSWVPLPPPLLMPPWLCTDESEAPCWRGGAVPPGGDDAPLSTICSPVIRCCLGDPEEGGALQGTSLRPRLDPRGLLGSAFRS